jgi:hypothetical protein
VMSGTVNHRYTLAELEGWRLSGQYLHLMGKRRGWAALSMAATTSGALRWSWRPADMSATTPDVKPGDIWQMARTGQRPMADKA